MDGEAKLLRKIKRGNTDYVFRNRVIILKDGKLKRFNSVMDCAKYLDVTRTAVHNVLNGKRSEVKGYEVNYANTL